MNLTHVENFLLVFLPFFVPIVIRCILYKMPFYWVITKSVTSLQGSFIVLKY